MSQGEERHLLWRGSDCDFVNCLGLGVGYYSLTVLKWFSF